MRSGECKCPEIPNVKLNTDWEIPLVGFGTYKITGQESVSKAIDAALSIGYRHFDTAKLYNNEPELGVALEKLLPKYGLRREDIFITTKFFPAVAEEAATKVPQLVEESLTNLETSYVDLILIHYPKPTMPDVEDNDSPGNLAARKETWHALEAIPTSKIHSIGVSNYEVRHLEEMLGTSDDNSGYATRAPAVNQVEYHPHFRRAALKNYCAEKGIFFQAFSSLARMHPDLIGDPVVCQLAEKYRTSVEVGLINRSLWLVVDGWRGFGHFQTILLSFATSQRVGIVPKSEHPERIKANLDCLQVKLTAEELAQLNSIDKDVNYIRTKPWLVK